MPEAPAFPAMSVGRLLRPLLQPLAELQLQ